MPNYISEEQIEQAAIELLVNKLGYQHINCYTANPEDLNDNSGRSDKEEVVLKEQLQKKLVELNGVPAAIAGLAVEELSKGRRNMSPMRANKEVYNLLINGLQLETKNAQGQDEPLKVNFIDFEKPTNNDFTVVSQLWIKGIPGFRRPDLILYINGIPLVFIELKNSNIKLKNAYDDNLTTYHKEIGQLFNFNAVTMLSNGMETRLGAFGAEWEHFFEWLRAEDESEAPDRTLVQKEKISLDYALCGLCSKDNLLDYIENFILFHQQGHYKIIAKNHQYIGVNKSFASFKEREQKSGKLGVFWHTQGSGKSFSMIMFVNKIIRKIPGNFTFMIVTDRENLDKQIYKNFHNMGAVKDSDFARPNDGLQLREYLASNKKFIFTLIQKFRYEKGQTYPLLSERDDIVVIVDEAHRTQYKDLAENMRAGIPRAQYIAFTGTPLLGSKRLTNRFFGDYVSEYNFRQSYEDGATVKLYYDKRVPEVQLINDDLNEELAEIVEEENLSEEDVLRLERKFATELTVLRDEDRLQKVAKDIVAHFPQRGYLGRGMVVSVDKFTAVKMYNFVQHYWKDAIKEWRIKLKKAADDSEKERIKKIIRYMNWVEMAVVISFDDSDDEEKKFAEHGLDIKPHIKKMKAFDENGFDLEYRFQEMPDDPFQLVFVCAKWLTGFDSPTLSDLYLDKPMVGHTLMQAIARVNRVAPGKKAGFIIDYYGVFRNLKKALAVYAEGTKKEADDEAVVDFPVEDKSHLFVLLAESIEYANDYCKTLDIDLNRILTKQDVFKNLNEFEQYADKILSKDEYKKNFFVYVNTVEGLYDACKPEIFGRKKEYPLLEVLRYLRKIVDRKKFTGNIDAARIKYEDVIDQSITVVSEPNKEYDYEIKKSKMLDLSKFNFEKLRDKFKNADYKSIEIEDLKIFIEEKLAKLLEENVTRINLKEKLEAIIYEYNSGSLSVENYFEELVRFSEKLRDEEQRHIKEELTPEELELFDLLSKPKEKLTKKELQSVKLAAKELLKRLREERSRILVVDWYKTQETKLVVLDFVKKELNRTLPESYDRLIFDKACNIVINHFQHLEEYGRNWAA